MAKRSEERSRGGRQPPNARRCVGCRKVASKETFWRVVRLYPSRTVQLDEGMGRSAYLCPNESCLKAARHKNRLGRALKAAVPEAIYQRLFSRLSEVDSDNSPGEGEKK